MKRIRLRTGRSRELIGAVAAVVVVVLLAGLLAVLFRGSKEPESVGAGAVASPSSTTPGTTSSAYHTYHNLSLAQAQQLVGFTIVEPRPLPDMLQPVMNESVSTSAIGSTGLAKANYVMFVYLAKDQMEKGVLVAETTAPAAALTTSDGVLSWGDQNGEPATMTYDHLTKSTVSIAGVTVTKLDATTGDAHIIYFTWQMNGVTFITFTKPGPDVTEAVFEQFVAAMIASARAPATPSAAASAVPTLTASQQGTITFAEAQQQVPFPVTEPHWLPEYLVAQRVRLGSSGATPDKSAQLLLDYGPKDGSQSYSVQIVEYAENHHAQPPGTPEALTMAGHVIAHSTTNDSKGTQSFFVWHDQGTIFQLIAELAGLLTEQDVEHMIGSMLGGGGTTQASPATGSALPTPNANGLYANLTLEQAQQLAPFKIVMPIDLPPSLTFGGLSLSIPPVAPAGLAKGVPNIADMTFGSSDDPPWFIEISEIWVGMQPPNTPSAPATATSASGTPPVPADHALPPTFRIDDVTVTKDAATNGEGQPVVTYEWIQGKAKIFLFVAHFDVEHEPDIYNMIASMIAQGS